MQSAPARIAWIKVSTLARPVMARTVAKVDQLVDDCLDPQALSQRGGQQEPGVGHRVGVVERHNKPGGAVEDGLEKVPS
jgi:hypothetical protein